MAGPLLAGTRTGTLVVAGNAHTPTRPTEPGVPLGARLAAGRPGVKEIRIRYGAGRFYNLEPRRFPPDPKVRRGLLRLGLRHGSLLLDLPGPSEAIVPHRRSISAPNGAAACRPQAKAIESSEGSVGIVAAIAREVQR
jgi:hypothetical protein